MRTPPVAGRPLAATGSGYGMAEPQCIVPSGDWTGEGAVWKADENALYWVDIERRLIHRFDVDTRAAHSWFLDEPPTALGLTDRPDTLVVALGSRVILWQPANDARVDFARPDVNWPTLRLNDGRPDPFGNFWVGSMAHDVGDDASIDTRSAGSLYRIAPDGAVSVEKTGIGIANTVCWSPVGDRFYFGDTLTNTIGVWDYDLATGTIRNEKAFFSGFDRGLPDGSAVDRDGYLWNARWGGGCVVRVAPDGSLDRVVEMPVDNITTCAFGGRNLRTLFITSARGGSGARERFAGGLFALKVETPGLAENVFRIGR